MSTTAIIVIAIFVMFFFKGLLKVLSRTAESTVTAAAVQLEKETLVLTEIHDASIKQRLAAIDEELAQLPNVNIDERLAQFRKTLKTASK